MSDRLDLFLFFAAQASSCGVYITVKIGSVVPFLFSRYYTVYTVEPLYRSIWAEEIILSSEVEMHARVVVGVGKGALFREVSSVQECPHI